jgi:hypothetical protein
MCSKNTSYSEHTVYSLEYIVLFFLPDSEQDFLASERAACSSTSERDIKIIARIEKNMNICAIFVFGNRNIARWRQSMRQRSNRMGQRPG